MLYLFDLDGTLISGYMDTPDKDYQTWQVLPGRREHLAELLARGNSIAIVPNQRGVAFGFISPVDVARKLSAAVRELGLPATTAVYRCYDDTRGQPPFNDPLLAALGKPSGAMLRQAMRDHPEAATLGVLMIGDRPEDEQAAQDAGVSFQWAHVFFKERP